MNCCWLMPPKMFCKSWSPIQNKIHKKYDISTWDMVCIAAIIKFPHQNFSKAFQFTFINCINCKFYYCLKFEQYECYFQWILRKKTQTIPSPLSSEGSPEPRPPPLLDPGVGGLFKLSFTFLQSSSSLSLLGS